MVTVRDDGDGMSGEAIGGYQYPDDEDEAGMDAFPCGHDRTPENTAWGGKCRECKRARDRRRTERYLESERARKRAFIRELRYRQQDREVPGPPKAGNYHGPFSPADWAAREAERVSGSRPLGDES